MNSHHIFVYFRGNADCMRMDFSTLDIRDKAFMSMLDHKHMNKTRVWSNPNHMVDMSEVVGMRKG